MADDPTQQLEDVAAQAPGQLGQALQNQQNQPAPAPPQPQQPDPVSAGLDQAAQHYSQQLQQNQQPVASGGPIRRLLQNFIGGMGNSMMEEAGLSTPIQKQQMAIQGLQGVAQAKSHLATIQAIQAQNAPVPLVGLDGKAVTDGSGNPITLPANHAQTWYAAQAAAASRVQVQGMKSDTAETLAEGPTLTPEQAAAMGHPEMAGQGLNKALGSIIQNQAGKMPITQDMIDQYKLPPESLGKLAKMSDILSAQRLQMMGTRTTTGGTWKETSPGQWSFLPTTSTMTRGPQGAGGPQAQGGGHPLNQPGVPHQLKTFTGGGPIYAFNPKTNETVLTTPTEAQQLGYTNPRKAGTKEIQDDTSLGNRLADVATKVTRYDEFMKNGNLSQADRDMISGVLSSDKFELGAHGFGAGVEIPVDRLNQALDAANVKNMSLAAKNALLGYINARESIQGYQRVLSGSAKSSETGLQLNLAALPSPVMPNDYIHNGVQQFGENVKLAGRGIPRMPGVPTANDILSPQASSGQSGPTIRIRTSDGRVGTIPAANLQKWQQKGATVLK